MRVTDAKTYWVAPDADGDDVLWSGTSPDDPSCDTVAYKLDLDRMDPILWPTVVSGLVPPVLETDELLADVRSIYRDERDGHRLAHAVRHYRTVTWEAGHKIGLREAKQAVERICWVPAATTGPGQDG